MAVLTSLSFRKVEGRSRWLRVLPRKRGYSDARAKFPNESWVCCGSRPPALAAATVRVEAPAVVACVVRLVSRHVATARMVYCSRSCMVFA